MLDDVVIPKGDYCYTIEDIIYNKDKPPVIKTKVCHYYKCIGNSDFCFCQYCNLMGLEQDYILLGDQCKICGINTE